MRVWTGLVTALMLCHGRTGFAEKRVTDNSAFTLERGDIRLGFLRSGVGLPTPSFLSGLEFSTYPIPWGALFLDEDTFGVQVANGQLKASRTISHRWTAALAITALYGSVGTDVDSASLFALPLEAYLNRDINDWLSVGGLVQYTHVSISGHTSTGSENEAEEAGHYRADAVLRTSTTHLGINSELRFARWISLLSEARVTSFGRVTGEASGMFAVDENTSVEAYGEASAKPLKFGYSVKGVAHLTLGWANLRVGLSYGNYVMPMLNMAVPVRYLMPTANLYVRL